MGGLRALRPTGRVLEEGIGRKHKDPGHQPAPTTSRRVDGPEEAIKLDQALQEGSRSPKVRRCQFEEMLRGRGTRDSARAGRFRATPKRETASPGSAGERGSTAPATPREGRTSLRMQDVPPRHVTSRGLGRVSPDRDRCQESGGCEEIGASRYALAWAKGV